MENNRSNSIVGLEKAKIINELNLTTAKIGELKNSNPIDNYEIASCSYKIRILSEKLSFLKSIDGLEDFSRIYFMSKRELEEIKNIMKIDINTKLLDILGTKDEEWAKYNELKYRKQELKTKKFYIEYKEDISGTYTPEEIQHDIDNISRKIALHYIGVNSVFLELKRSSKRLQSKLNGIENKSLEEIRTILLCNEVPSAEKREEYRKLLNECYDELPSNKYLLSKTNEEYGKASMLASLLAKIGCLSRYSYSYEYSIPVYKYLPKKIKNVLLDWNTLRNGKISVSNPTGYYNKVKKLNDEEFTKKLESFYMNYSKDLLLQVLIDVDPNNISKEFFEFISEFHYDKIDSKIYSQLFYFIKIRENIKSVNFFNKFYVKKLDKYIYMYYLQAKDNIYKWYCRFNSEILELGESSIVKDVDKLDEALSKWKELVEQQKEAVDSLLDYLAKASAEYKKRNELITKKSREYRQQIINLYNDGDEDINIPDDYYSYDEALEAIMNITLKEYMYNIVNIIRRQANKMASCREVEIKNRFKGDSSEEAYAYDLKL